tara:strand:+ start:2331 stop:2660 length:330 start_codon:yes stop_codon:yes gene_type:complete
MEIKVDVGVDTYNVLEKISKIKEQNLDVTFAEMLSLGARLYLNSLEKKEDKVTKVLLTSAVNNNKILSEILHIIFDKNKSELGVYDADTALGLIRRMTKDYIDEVIGGS